MAALFTALATALGAVPFLFSRGHTANHRKDYCSVTARAGPKKTRQRDSVSESEVRASKNSQLNESSKAEHEGKLKRDDESLPSNEPSCSTGQPSGSVIKEEAEDSSSEEDAGESIVAEQSAPYWIIHANSITAGMMLGCALILLAEAFQDEGLIDKTEQSIPKFAIWSARIFVFIGLASGILLVIISQLVVGDGHPLEQTETPQARDYSSPNTKRKSTSPEQSELMHDEGISESDDGDHNLVTIAQPNQRSDSAILNVLEREARAKCDLDREVEDVSRACCPTNLDSQRTSEVAQENSLSTHGKIPHPDGAKHLEERSETQRRVMKPPPVQGASIASATRKSILVMLVMFVHSFAEGVSLGVSWAKTPALGSFVSLSLAAHNIPEGLTVSLSVIQAGGSVGKAALWSFISSLPQPVAAIPAYFFVQRFAPLLPIGLGFAAGAMLWLPISELLPEALADPRSTRSHVALVTAGACLCTLMFGLDWDRAFALMH